MTKYEMMFIVKSTNEGTVVANVADEVQKIAKANKIKVSDFKEMGLKKLAYPIKKEINGFYYVMTFEAPVEAVKELDRKVSINENVLRHLIVKLESE